VPALTGQLPDDEHPPFNHDTAVVGLTSLSEALASDVRLGRAGQFVRASEKATNVAGQRIERAIFMYRAVEGTRF